MSFFDDASLVFLPSGEAGKDGKAYSMKPTNGDGDFTFSRGSNLTATRVDSNGLIEKGRENLLLQSNSFDTTWVATNASVTSGQSGYDGSSDAWLLSKSASQFIRINQSLSPSVSGIWTFSVYAKEGTTSIMNLRDMTNADRVQFDLSGSGSVDAEFGNILSKIESVGNGWFRCSATFNGTCSSVGIYVGWNDSTASNIYIQDAQLEVGLAATEYIESGATTGKAGLLENEPRFDYSGGASCPALLLEPQRTNQVTYSEYFGASYWSKTNSAIIDNAILSPEGVQNATELFDNATSGAHFVYKSAISASSNHMISFFAKANTLSQVFVNGGASLYAYVDLINGVKLSGTADTTIENYGNGWWRISIISDRDGILIATSKNTNNNYSGSGESIYIYGVQSEEAASYPTSYIPNHSGGSVTRNADGQTLDITNLISSTEGTLFFHLKDAKSHSQTNKILGIGDGSGVDNFFGLYVNDFQTGAVGIRNRQANADLMNTAIPNPQNAKVAIKFSPSGVKTFLNGSEFQSSATAYTGWATSFDLNTSVGDVDLKQYFLFPTALSDAECITLTS